MQDIKESQFKITSKNNSVGRNKQKRKKIFRVISVSDTLSSSGYNSNANDNVWENQSFNTISKEGSPVSLSSSSWRNVHSSSPLTKSSNDIIDSEDNQSVWERFTRILPLAKRDMELKLCQFIEQYNCDYLQQLNINPCEKFAAKQIIELARKLCTKSLSFHDSLTNQYFHNIDTKIRQLVNETTLRCPEDILFLTSIITKFNLITGNVIRMLVCLENNPDQTNFNDEFIGLINADENLQTYVSRLIGESPIYSDKKRSSVYIKKGDKLFSISIKSSNTAKKDDPNTSVTSIDPSMPKESDFSNLKLISQGKYSAVYLVRHNTKHNLFAMKKIPKSHALIKNQVRQIFAERDILSFAENPFVISMLCSFETQNSYCMVMEYAEGGDCASLLKMVGYFSLETARSYIAETIVAVDYIHNYGIIHRDIKPDNLLITSLGHIKLTDFGLSKIGLMNLAISKPDENNESFRDFNIFGTPNYIAPEVILNRPYNQIVDYWSVGIVLYEFLLGCTPFYGDTVEEVFEAIVSKSIEWPMGKEALPVTAQDLIEKLLERNPSLRLGNNNNVMTLKTHPFFNSIQWNNLLQIKMHFLPQIKNNEDTSYFDDRSDRYDHHSILTDTNDPFTECSSSFTSYTKKYQHYLSLRDSVSVTPGNVPKQQNYMLESKQMLLFSMCTSIELLKDVNTNTFGFSFKTVRINCGNDVTFLLHIIDSVRSELEADSAHISYNSVIVKINSVLVIGVQHVEILRLISSTTIMNLQCISLESMGIIEQPDTFQYYINPKLPIFCELIQLNVKFEQYIMFNYIPVKLDTTGNIITEVPNIDSHSILPVFHKKKSNIVKKYLKKLMYPKLVSSVTSTIMSGRRGSATPVIKVNPLIGSKLSPQYHNTKSKK